MAVPGHDARDHEFARKYELPIVEVISGSSRPIHDAVFGGEGIVVNSEFLNGLTVAEAKKKMIRHLEGLGIGKGKVQYRLRDWLFSRQRYWGEPIPVINVEGKKSVAVSSEDLPVLLPMIDSYRPTADGQPPLARADDEWLKVRLSDGTEGYRETNTMPQWAGSCWYYLRFLDPKNDEAPFSSALEQYWMPVDLYIGGVEHAVLHLLYARFWHKVLYDCGLVHTKEPFQKLFNQGMILAHSYRDRQGKYYYPSQVEARDGKFFVKETNEETIAQIEKMSKSKFNVVNPDDVIDKYGADAMRLYELFMGPLEQVKMWQMSGVEGVYRFLHRVWRLIIDEESGEISSKITSADPEQHELWRKIHKCIKKVEEDILSLRFNTAIAHMMTFVNEAMAATSVPQEIALRFVQILSPFAPHVAEELWERLGKASLLSNSEWPQFDPALCKDDEVVIVLQVNGKKRDEILVLRDTEKADLERLALESEQVHKFLDGREPKRVIVVPNRLVNVVG